MRSRISPLSPLVAFPALWVLGAALAQVHLLDVQRPWPAVTWAVVAVVPVAFVLGGVVGRAVVASRVPVAERHSAAASSRRLRVVLVACLALGWLTLAWQFATARSVPLLSGNMDAARFGLPGGPSVVLLNLLTVAAIVALVVPRDLLARESRFELCVAGAALGGFALAGGRSQVVLPLVAAGLARAIFWGPPSRRALAIGVPVLLLAFSAVFYVRLAQNFDNPYELEIYNEVIPGVPLPLRPLVPLVLSVALNFQALSGIVEHIPRSVDFGGGAFNALGLDAFIPGARDIGPLSGGLTPPWVTNTIAGPLYADGGVALVVLGVALTGVLTSAAYTLARRTLELRHALAAGYLLYYALFGIYTNLWTQHADWLMVAPMLLAVGALAQDPVRPPGLPWSSIRRVRTSGLYPGRSARRA